MSPLIGLNDDKDAKKLRKRIPVVVNNLLQELNKMVIHLGKKMSNIECPQYIHLIYLIPKYK